MTLHIFSRRRQTSAELSYTEGFIVRLPSLGRVPALSQLFFVFVLAVPAQAVQTFVCAWLAAGPNSFCSWSVSFPRVFSGRSRSVYQFAVLKPACFSTMS